MPFTLGGSILRGANVSDKKLTDLKDILIKVGLML